MVMVNILDYLFPEDQPVSDEPVWHDAANAQNNLSPRRLLQWVKRVGFGMDRLGIRRGDIIMIYTPNHIFVPAAYLGIVGSCRAFSAANPIYTVPEVTHQLKNTGAVCILAHPSMVSNAVEAAKAAGLPKERVFQFSDQPCPTSEGVKDWRELVGSPEEAESYKWKKLQGEEAVKTVATINYSSGTTGLPKGVCVSHHNLIANVMQTILVRWPKRAAHEKVTERWVGFLPLYHAYGQLYANLIATKLSIPIYIMKQFVYADFLECIQQYKITHLQVAPPIMVMLTKRPETAKYDLSSVKGILCGAAPMSKELQNTVSRQFNVEVKQGWGMTEVTCGSILELTPSDTGTVGKLISNTECKLLDDDGKEVGYDTPGEMYIRAPNVCMGYFKNDAATEESISSDGWLKTGDVAVVNKEGLFWIVDRKKELIKVNALQVAPAELEAVLLEHDDIADAAVVGITLHGEEWPRAYVAVADHAKGKLTAKDIAAYMKVKVAKHKQLVGGIAFVDEVPKLASGKIQRKVMREWAKRDAPGLEKEMGSNLILYVASNAIYNLYFHPLAKFPGPRINAISPLPGIIALLKGRLPLENKKLHEKYGSVVRVSPNELAFNSDPIHVGSVEAVQGVTTLTMADDDNHARQRRALSHSFSQKALVEQEYIIKRYVDQFIANLKGFAERDEQFNLVNWLNFTTFDIFGDLAFGEPFGCLDLGRYHEWVALIYEAVKAGAIEQATRRFAPAGSLTQTILVSLIPKRIRDYRSEHLRRSREKCMKRLENGGSQHRDFIWYILKQQEKHGLKQDEIIVNSALFIVAGSETTANLLSGLLARLLWNPDKYRKLVDEIRGAFQNESDVNYENLSKLTYLNACIEEGLRIHPPVPTGLLRTVPEGGDTIDGDFVPGGTSVAVGSWSAAHNPVNFRDCDAFIPERFLDKAYDSDYKKAVQPFSLGPRGCIGRHLSYLEMRLILGRLLWNFDIESVDGAWQWDPAGDMKNMRAFMTWEKPDMNVKVRALKR
ncbi:hypothetical protein LTR85_002900 [Meristemomyces frigidus]|nr:hypothetical protein LTR85_002900 [Meristemomyces frigidus]